MDVLCVGMAFFIFFLCYHSIRPSFRSLFLSFYQKKKKTNYSGAHSRVATLIQPSFQK